MPNSRMGSARWIRGPTLGRGSTATVSLAVPRAHSSPPNIPTYFAVKSSDLSSSSLLQREQRIMSSLQSNSNHVVSYLGFDVTSEGGRPMYNLFMECAPGGSIFDEIQRRGGGGLDERRVRSHARGILLGLSYLHSLDLAHCDIKGRNVLIGSDGQAKIADFGCARWVVAAAAAAGADDCCFRLVCGGTPAFMAPEVARGEAAQQQGTEADIWSLGCTVIEMATGRPPWPDAADPISVVHRIAFSDDVPEIPNSISDEARDFLEKCLRRGAADRWTAEELLRHPFVVAVKRDEDDSSHPRAAKLDWSSPKCVLDGQSLWGEESDDDEGEMAPAEDKWQEQERETNGPGERVGQLAGVSDDVVSSIKCWEWDSDGNWIVVRESGPDGRSECSTSSWFLDDDVKEDQSRAPAAAADSLLESSFSLSECCCDSLQYCFNYLTCNLKLDERKKIPCYCYPLVPSRPLISVKSIELLRT